MRCHGCERLLPGAQLAMLAACSCGAVFALCLVCESKAPRDGERMPAVFRAVHERCVGRPSQPRQEEP